MELPRTTVVIASAGRVPLLNRALTHLGIPLKEQPIIDWTERTSSVSVNG